MLQPSDGNASPGRVAEEHLMDEFCEDLTNLRSQRHDDNSSNGSTVNTPANSKQSSTVIQPDSSRQSNIPETWQRTKKKNQKMIMRCTSLLIEQSINQTTVKLVPLSTASTSTE